MSTPDGPDRSPAAAAADDEHPLDPDQSDVRPSSLDGLHRALHGARHMQVVDLGGGTSSPVDDLQDVFAHGERGAVAGRLPTGDSDVSDTSFKAVQHAADAPSVADTRTGPAPVPAGGFSIPLKTEEQVQRRNALRARIQANLAQRKAARAS